MPDNQTKAIIGTAVAVGTAVAGLAYLYKRNAKETVPTKWKQVGEIIDLNCFPIKSCAPVKRASFECNLLGFEYESIFDRCFIIVQGEKQLTARTYPKMVLIQPKVVGNVLIISAPERADFVLNLDKLADLTPNRNVELWYSKVGGVDCGDDVANWLSECIVGKPGVVRLLYYRHLYPTKGRKKGDPSKYKAYKSEDVGIYQDESSYMLINQASIDELNTHLDHVVKPLQFRPTMVVKGPTAYEEDNWKWVRIGDVVFRGLKPCQRCVFTNINPDNGERNPAREPLETLKKTRTLIPNESPVMGLHLAIRTQGAITIGDAVYINDESEA
ncbi:mitochondrial amidoxime-reducing component 1-like isoform X2 [Sitodiplosis mosellana]|uniref:mitochondrial amidoxime-reducing component 1-like isoform X2 n=1 Tax=Sitodiplosis mosellana TaxID=263140 RepID=UPI002444C55D|nr:mitochondrial amidoxime-reducing component 1-like isoform X2 [Sitodiplosis mosellana]